MSRRSWHGLNPRARRLLLAAGAVEGILKIVALVDLARRPADQVRGSKLVWAISISLANSMGAVPIGYLLRGRRR